MPRIELRKKLRVKRESIHLTEYAADVTSQWGENGVIEKIFELISVKNKFCVEFGAWDGIHLSNSRPLIVANGWSGLLIEGDTERFPILEENYRDNPEVQTLNRYVGFGDNSLDAILTSAGAPTDFDLLSIDIDGNDWHVWDSLTSYRPQLIVIEFNPSVPNDVLFVQDRDASINQGASLSAMIELGKQKGYELAAVLGSNGLFVTVEDFSKLGIADNDIDAMNEPLDKETKIFQGYDGTLFLAGCQHLLWKGVPFSADDIQVLPTAARQYFEPIPGDNSGYVPTWRATDGVK